MAENLKVELPICADCKLLSTHNTIGEIKSSFNLRVIKYTFFDPLDSKYKARNPLDDLQLVPDALIVVAGEIDEIIKFSEEATNK